MTQLSSGQRESAFANLGHQTRQERVVGYAQPDNFGISPLNRVKTAQQIVTLVQPLIHARLVMLRII